MGDPYEEDYPMTDDDHISICRFKSKDDRYKQVLDVLRRFAAAAAATAVNG